MPAQTLYLCAGLQSSGSTLISWCFLQRPDMDGVLDAAFDSLPEIPPGLAAPLPWCKFTIACFSFAEVQQYFEDEGWTIQPLLVIRDVRAVFNSLINKKYGRNGTTADDPPLRTRLRRFKSDWQLFKKNNWPILRYEDMADDPIAALKKACRELALPWDAAMVEWPKAADQIAAAVNGNATFASTRGSGLLASVKPSLAEVKVHNIPPADLRWLETEFAEFNRESGYAQHIPSANTDTPFRRAIPNYNCTRRGRQRQSVQRRRRRMRLAISIATILLLALTVLADAMNWIKFIDFI
jgi:hypothetical protein